jgi:hypothetical protein
MDRKKALVVGIDYYPGQELHDSVSDAREVAQLFRRHGDDEPNFDVELFTAPVPKPDGNIPPPEDPDAEISPKGGITKDLLRDRIKALFEGDSDIVLFYFSGHGSLTSVGGTLITTDIKKAEDGLEMNDVLIWANNSQAREKVIILDCCHSGAFGSANTSNKLYEISEGMIVFTAALPAQQAMESNSRGHGVFTELLAEALNGAAADLLGQVTPGAIYHYVDQALGSWEQRPIFRTNVTGWTPLRKVPPGPDSPAIPRAMLRNIVRYFPTAEDEYKLTPDYEASDPGHDPKKVAIFTDLRTLAGVDLVVPVDEDHLCWAAMHSKSCKLTTLGKRYWWLVKHNRV